MGRTEEGREGRLGMGANWEIVGDLPVELHLLLRESDVRMQWALLLRFLHQFMQDRHQFLRICALDALEGFLVGRYPSHSAGSPHAIFQHAYAFELL